MRLLAKNYSRREFIKTNIAVGTGAALGAGTANKVLASSTAVNKTTPAVLGGEPQVTSHDWPSWPIWKPETDEKRLLEVMRSGVWSRRKVTDEFEKKWAQLMGAKRCLAVVNGTNALNTSLAQLKIN